MDIRKGHRPPSGRGYGLRSGRDTVGTGRFAGRLVARRGRTVKVLDRDRDGGGRPVPGRLDHDAVRPGRQGHARAVGSARATGRHRPLPPRTKSHEFGYGAHNRRRSASLRLMAYRWLDVRVFRGVRSLLSVLRGTGTRTQVRRRLSALQVKRPALDSADQAVGRAVTGRKTTSSAFLF